MEKLITNILNEIEKEQDTEKLNVLFTKLSLLKKENEDIFRHIFINLKLNENILEKFYDKYLRDMKVTINLK